MLIIIAAVVVILAGVAIDSAFSLLPLLLEPTAQKAVTI
jgi:hypothetical protein